MPYISLLNIILKESALITIHEDKNTLPIVKNLGKMVNFEASETKGSSEPMNRSI
jgi:hypothetical protein